jgi:hypothetical protein
MTTVSQSENQESSEGADEMPTFSAAGREPAGAKRRAGADLSFWGERDEF